MVSRERPPFMPPQPDAAETLRVELRQALARLFAEAADPEHRVQAIRQKLSFVGEEVPELKEAVERAIAAGRESERERFLDAELRALEPLIQLRVHQPGVIEGMRHTRMRHESNWDKITDLLAYEITEDGWLRLHVPDQK